MNQLERDLRESLGRRQPPPGFADRVLARTRQPEPRRISWVWLAAAAMVLLMIGGIGFVREQRRQAEGEKAKLQLMAGLRITGSKLSQVQARLSRIQQRAEQPRLEQ
jgi:preprotein translocase subunit Sss1